MYQLFFRIPNIFIYIYILKVSNRGAQKISGEAGRGFAGTVSFFT